MNMILSKPCNLPMPQFAYLYSGDNHRPHLGVVVMDSLVCILVRCGDTAKLNCMTLAAVAACLEALICEFLGLPCAINLWVLKGSCEGLQCEDAGTPWGAWLRELSPSENLLESLQDTFQKPAPRSGRPVGKASWQWKGKIANLPLISLPLLDSLFRGGKPAHT